MENETGAPAPTSRIEQQFRRLLEKLPAGAYTCDAAGLITYFNQHAVQLWGREPRLNDAADRFCGSFKLFATDGTPISHDQCWMAQALRNQREYNGHEIVVERPDGQRLTTLAHASPIRDEAGNLLGAVNVLVDITDRKRAEEALKEADRRKDEFLAMLAHELRNPLAPVRNALQFLRLRVPADPQIEWARDVIDRQVSQLARLIDDLLEVSRISRGKLALEKGRVDLATVVSAALETSRPLAEARRHRVSVFMPREPLFLEADLVRLSQALSNVLNNAAKYTDEGGRIELRVERCGSEAEIRVTDTGIGIPKEMLRRIFEPFTQLDHSLARAQGGLGIGLTLVQQIVLLHGGRVEARSEGVGTGSTFVIRLPLQASAQAVPRFETGPAPVQRSPYRRVLVVDDNVDSADSLAAILELMGFEVQTAYDGQEALQLAEESCPDVVLLDIGLPKIDGYEVAKRIRRNPALRSVMLVALTGYGQEEDRRRAKESGFDHHLLKPAKLEAVEAIVGLRA